ncbi:homeotic protein Sex combs reduced isoform X2 [Drosophila ficusphila]|uniref:homeotic protein Sex combs reduced isoform X2 n=1 Tax=Drosophila ficusphila TaxID=30025 RepID=UPI0007E5E868|nr:homeotic protein Sex combs reduced isoform X2 [Drosophila ficusphila]
MAGPQVQHSQRPNSAYYTGLNGGGSSGGGGGGGGSGAGGSSAGMASSASHTGLHALRQVSNETELIYRGSHSNGTVNELPSSAQHHLLTGRVVQHHQQHHHQHGQGHLPQQQHVSSIAGTGSSVTDALIGTTITGGSSGGGGAGGGGASGSSCSTSAPKLGIKKSSTQRSIEIIVDASQCGKELVASGSGAAGAGGGSTLDAEDVEQGGGQESSSSHRKSSRHRHRPLHRRLITYLRNLFQGSTTQNALRTLLVAWGCIAKHSELEEFETPARYRPDSLSALSRATRFTEDEIKRIYRGFKAECPTGVVKEDTFKVIYSQFFPQGANPTLYAHYVFNTLDQDHSGIVSFEDFVQGLSILSRGSVEEKLRWTFSLYDINGDGFITREEMTDIVTAIYELMGRLPDECPEEEKIKGKVEQIFQKMDTNRDGVVTLEEFLEACRNDDAISRSMSVFDTAF